MSSSPSTSAQRLRATFRPDGALLDILDADGGSGWQGLSFFVQQGDRSLVGQTTEPARPDDRRTTWSLTVAPGVTVSFTAEPSPNGAGVSVTPILTNAGDKPFAFDGYGFAAAPGAPGPRLGGHGLAIFAHSENLRYENLPASQPMYPFLRPPPEAPRWYGRQGVGPMPALIVGRLNQDRWLVEGALTQMRHMPSWRLGLSTEPGRLLDYRSAYCWNGSSAETVAPGASLELETTVYLLVDAAPDRFYDTYIDELVALHGDRFAGPHSRLATDPVYCTWNYGVFTAVNEADCIARMDVVQKVQGGGIFQLDHGYQPPHGQHASWGYLDAYYPDTAATWDRQRFPGGPEAFVDNCRKRGLLPAIWWTPRMDIGGPIWRDHPDWIAVDRDGRPLAHVGDLHPDYSVPQVRQFIERTLGTVIDQWGFEGIKLDFFSWAFDAPDAVYRNGGTSVQWRRWLLELVRRKLGPRGYFLHCVSCPLGNPFLALDGADAFRAGIDIDRGDWDCNVLNFSWMLASFPSVGRRTWFADMDSFMGHPRFPENERRFRCALGYMTGGMMDFSGPVELFDDAALRDYQLLASRCDQGARTLVPDRAAFFGRPLPRILARPHDPHGRTRKQFGVAATVALFNWEPSDQTIAVNLSSLNLAQVARARDFWTGREVPLDGRRLVADLPPRGHLLVDFSS